MDRNGKLVAGRQIMIESPTFSAPETEPMRLKE